MSNSATPWTAAHQTPLSSTISQNLLQFMSIQSVILTNHLILCHPLLLLPSIFLSMRVFSNDSALCIRWQSIGASTSASVLPKNVQGWFPLGLTGLISLLSKGLLTLKKTKIMACGRPITSRQTEGKKMEAVTDFIFLGFKITADGDWSHEIKRHLLLGGKLWQT